MMVSVRSCVRPSISLIPRVGTQNNLMIGYSDGLAGSLNISILIYTTTCPLKGSLGLPRVSVSGADLPSARVLSNIFAATGGQRPGVESTLLVMPFGQFLDHDLTDTPSFFEGKSKLV